GLRTVTLPPGTPRRRETATERCGPIDVAFFFRTASMSTANVSAGSSAFDKPPQLADVGEILYHCRRSGRPQHLYTALPARHPDDVRPALDPGLDVVRAVSQDHGVGAGEVHTVLGASALLGDCYQRRPVRLVVAVGSDLEIEKRLQSEHAPLDARDRS